MTHEDKGNYAGKHPDQAKDPVIAARLENSGNRTAFPVRPPTGQRRT